MKERIIGAAILVLFVVLVVPIFLDGPPDEAEMVSERVLLPGQDTQNTQTVVLDRNRTEPVPTAGSTTESQQAAVTPIAKPPAKSSKQAAPIVEKNPVPAPKAATPEEEPVAETPIASATGMWAVQLGSFSNKENAEKLAADLRKQGYAAFLSQLATSSGQLHRVRIGPQKDRQSAEAIADRLLKAGHKGQVVPHP